LGGAAKMAHVEHTEKTKHTSNSRQIDLIV
jgi:hypothetical protein